MARILEAERLRTTLQYVADSVERGALPQLIRRSSADVQIVDSYAGVKLEHAVAQSIGISEVAPRGIHGHNGPAFVQDRYVRCDRIQNCATESVCCAKPQHRPSGILRRRLLVSHGDPTSAVRPSGAQHQYKAVQPAKYRDSRNV